MTTGSRTEDGRSTVSLTTPSGQVNPGLKVGRLITKTWSGTDNRANKGSYWIPRPSFPPRPDLDNRLPNEDTRSFKRRRRKLLNEWLASVRRYQLQKKSRKGLLEAHRQVRVKMPPGQYSMTKTIRDDSWYFVKDAGRWYVNQMYPVGSPAHIPLDPKDYYATLEKLRRRVYGSGFNPGIMGVEGHKTLKMIGNSSKQIRLALVALYNGNWRGIIRQLGAPTPQWAGKARDGFVGFHEGRKSLSQAWLGFQYGWLPLVKDLDEGAAWLAEIISGGSATIYPSVRAKKAFVKSVWSDPAKDFGTQRCAFALQVTTHKVQLVITDLKCSPATGLPSMPSLAAVAWEALPYSFVCDWVAPIGSYLQALRTSKDLSGKLVTTVLSESWWDFPRPRANCIAYPAMQARDGYRIITMNRSISSEINPPTPLGDLSPSSVFSRWQRAANAVALLQNLRFPKLDRYGFKKIASSFLRR